MDGIYDVRSSFNLLYNRILYELLSFWPDVRVPHVLPIDNSKCSIIKVVQSFNSIGVHSTIDCYFLVVQFMWLNLFLVFGAPNTILCMFGNSEMWKTHSLNSADSRRDLWISDSPSPSSTCYGLHFDRPGYMLHFSWMLRAEISMF